SNRSNPPAPPAPQTPRYGSTSPYSGSSVGRASSTSASPSSSALAEASTSRASASEALERVPWNALSASAREKLSQMAANPSIYRRLPMAGARCNPELFDYILLHPNLVVELWKQMGYDELSMAERAPGKFDFHEKSGTVGVLQVLYQDDETTVAYCAGTYRGGLIGNALEGEMFLILQTRYTEDESGAPVVVCRLDAFADIKNPGADLLARTLSGLLGKIADTNFSQTMAFIDSVSKIAEESPNDFAATAARLEGLTPEARRLLVAKTSEVSAQARARARGEIVDYRLLPKKNSPTSSYARLLSREKNGLAAGSRPTSDASRGSNAIAGRPRFEPTSTLGGLDGDKPSLAKNSFALADDFEEGVDWDEEASPLKTAPTPRGVRTSSEKLAKARTSARYEETNEFEELELLDGADLSDEGELESGESDEFALGDGAELADADEFELGDDAELDAGELTLELPALESDETAFDADAALIDAGADDALSTDDGAIDASILDEDETTPLDADVEADAELAIAMPTFGAIPTASPSSGKPASKPRPLSARKNAPAPVPATAIASDDEEEEAGEEADLADLILPNFAPEAPAPAEKAAAKTAEKAAATPAKSAEPADDPDALFELGAQTPSPAKPSGETVWRPVEFAGNTVRIPASSQIRRVEPRQIERTAQLEKDGAATFRAPSFK
ncbi:MAG: hypothetical protein HUK22_05355, partial [Thermoguttaceae bacterium]|nr:hypothetical protein [Thermoguttaceae bacterium]